MAFNYSRPSVLQPDDAGDKVGSCRISHEINNFRCGMCFILYISLGPVSMSFRTLTQCFGSSWTIPQMWSIMQTHLSDQEQVCWFFRKNSFLLLLTLYLIFTINVKHIDIIHLFFINAVLDISIHQRILKNKFPQTVEAQLFSKLIIILELLFKGLYDTEYYSNCSWKLRFPSQE